MKQMKKHNESPAHKNWKKIRTDEPASNSDFKALIRSNQGKPNEVYNQSCEICSFYPDDRILNGGKNNRKKSKAE